MTNNDISKRINSLNNEDFIWIIYIGIIILSYIANYEERKYFLNKDNNAKDNYRKIMIFIFTVLVIVYLYFLKDSIDSVKSMKPNASDKEKLLNYMALIASILIVIAGIIYLYIAINDKDINVELAFNQNKYIYIIHTNKGDNMNSKLVLSNYTFDYSNPYDIISNISLNYDYFLRGRDNHMNNSEYTKFKNRVNNDFYK